MKWLAVYIYYAEPWEDLLQEAVLPFCTDTLSLGQAHKYFFIRYWERGPHIRLRFLVSNEAMEEVLKQRINDWFGPYLESKPSVYAHPEQIDAAQKFDWYPLNSLQYIEYEPEIDRYGGPQAMHLGEDQFYLSSETILQIIKDSEAWDYDAMLGSAIQLHLAFARAMGMDKAEAAEFYSWIYRAWLPMAVPMSLSDDDKVEALQTVVEVFQRQFEQQKEFLVPFIQELWRDLHADESFEEDWMNRWIQGNAAIAKGLYELAEQQCIEWHDTAEALRHSFNTPWEKIRFWSIYASYVHMVNNRLGVQNKDEGYLAYLLCRSLDSK